MNETELHRLLLRADALFAPKLTSARRKGWRALWLNPNLLVDSQLQLACWATRPSKAQACLLANFMMLAVYQTLSARELVLVCPIRSFDRCFPRKLFGKRKALGRASLGNLLKAASGNPEAGILVDWGQHMRKGGSAATSIRLSEALREQLFQEFLRLIASDNFCAVCNNRHDDNTGHVLLKNMKLKPGQVKEPGVLYGDPREFSGKMLPSSLAYRKDHLDDFNRLISKTKFHIDAFASQHAKRREEANRDERRIKARRREEELRGRHNAEEYDNPNEEDKPTPPIEEIEPIRGIRCRIGDLANDTGVIHLDSRLFCMNRVFNGSWHYGGRYYSQFSSFQRWYRPALIIDGMPAAELDFKCLHPTILYHRQGLELPRATPGPSKCAADDQLVPDLYSLLSGDRTANKKALNAALNSLSREEAKKSLLDRRAAKVGQYEKLFFLPPDFSSVDEFLDAMHDVYRPIAPFFFQAPWKQLQFIDSEIAKFVMRCLQLQGIPFVCLHDSFLVPAPKKEALRTAMATGYRTAMLLHFGEAAAEFTPIIDEKTFQ